MTGRRYKGPDFIRIRADLTKDDLHNPLSRDAVEFTDPIHKIKIGDIEKLNLALRLLSDSNGEVSEYAILKSYDIISDYRYWRNEHRENEKHDYMMFERGYNLFRELSVWVGEINNGVHPLTGVSFEHALRNSLSRLGVSIDNNKHAFEYMYQMINDIVIHIHPMRPPKGYFASKRRGRPSDPVRKSFTAWCAELYENECGCLPTGHRGGCFKLFVDQLYSAATRTDGADLSREVQAVAKEWRKIPKERKNKKQK